MKVTVQVVTRTDDGQEITKEVACVERAELTPATFGVSLAEGKSILEAIQEVVVEWQMHAYLHQQRHCPQCGKVRHSKGTHHIMFRTVFGALPVESPRLTHCACQTHDTHSFSPLADLLPEHTTPELLPGNQMGGLNLLWHEREALTRRPASGRTPAGRNDS